MTEPAAAAPATAPPAGGGCSVPPAIEQVSAAPIYADRAGSVADSAGMHQNEQLITPLRLFDRALTTKVDGRPTAAELACATTLLRAWADAGALLQEPSSFPPVRERQRFTLGINVGALKLQSHGGVLDDKAMQWLHTLNTAVMSDFGPRNIVDNLYVWSGVDAGTFALLSGDEAARAYQDRAWKAGLAQIGPDGFLHSELRRQAKALGYHQYYLSGLLYLRKVRAALQMRPTPEEDAAVRRLANLVEASLCDPTAMAKAAGGFKQDTAQADQFAIGLLFGSGITDERWTRCGLPPPQHDDETMGGSLSQTLTLLEAEARSPAGTPRPVSR